MKVPFSITKERAAGLVAVTVLHAAALYGLWANNLLPSVPQASTLFVEFITASPPPPPPVPVLKRPAEPVKLRPVERVQPQQLAATPLPTAPPAPVVAAPPPVPLPVTPMEAPRPTNAGPVAMGSELSVACPQRTSPAYPKQSRRMGESGLVVLRVELDETGTVTGATVKTSSGFPKLDEAALAAVRTWRCTPASRNGQNVRAYALQPFNFLMQ